MVPRAVAGARCPGLLPANRAALAQPSSCQMLGNLFLACNLVSLAKRGIKLMSVPLCVLLLLCCPWALACGRQRQQMLLVNSRIPSTAENTSTYCCIPSTTSLCIDQALCRVLCQQVLQCKTTYGATDSVSTIGQAALTCRQLRIARSLQAERPSGPPSSPEASQDVSRPLLLPAHSEGSLSPPLHAPAPKLTRHIVTASEAHRCMTSH